MTSPTLGAPVETGPNQTAEFNYIPGIQDLLGRRYHLGVEYLQVCTDHQMIARAAGFKPIRGADLYSIRGTKGEAQMALMGQGSPISGTTPDMGIPVLLIDADVARRTGHESDGEWTVELAPKAAGLPEPAEEAVGLPEEEEPDERAAPPGPGYRKHRTHPRTRMEARKHAVQDS